MKHIFRSLVVMTLLFLLTPLSASALTADQNALPGASNAADYQPPTGNPQNNVGGVSQGSTTQNNLQKPETVDQTALPIVPDLRVSGVTSQPNANTTKTEIHSDKNQKNTWVAILFGAVAVAVAVFIVSSAGNRKTKKSSEATEVEQAAPPLTEPEPTPIVEETVEVVATETTEAPKTTPKVVKKTTKRKKGKNKKSKRKR